MLTETLNKLKVIALAAITLVVLIVVLQNTQAVETKLLFFTLTMPNAALLFGTLIVGFAIGVVTAGHIVSIAKRALPRIESKETSHVKSDSRESGQAKASRSHVPAGTASGQRP